MKNRLIATLAVSALAAGISAAAQADAHPYAGVSGGYFRGNADIQDGNTSEGTAGLQLGYHIDKDWSVELGHQEGIATRNYDEGREHLRNVSLTAAYRLAGHQTTTTLPRRKLYGEPRQRKRVINKLKHANITRA